MAGTLIYTTDATNVEIAAAAGLDFVVIDTEHSSKNTETVVEMVRAANAFDITPMVRARGYDDPRLLNYLEAGVQGVVIPMMETAAQAMAANDVLRYPPAGNRGNCTVTRNARYGDHRANFAEYQQACNDELLCVGLIETSAGVKNLAAILDTGVDVTITGRVDLAASLGVSGQFNHPLVTEAAARALTTVTAHETAFAGHIPYDVTEMQNFAAQGYQFFLYSADVFILRNALKTLPAKFPDAMSELPEFQYWPGPDIAL